MSPHASVVLCLLVLAVTVGMYLKSRADEKAQAIAARWIASWISCKGRVMDCETWLNS